MIFNEIRSKDGHKMSNTLYVYVSGCCCFAVHNFCFCFCFCCGCCFFSGWFDEFFVVFTSFMVWIFFLVLFILKHQKQQRKQLLYFTTATITITINTIESRKLVLPTFRYIHENICTPIKHYWINNISFFVSF